MKADFTVSVWQEDDLFIAQCLDVDVASQGRTEEEAVANLREALELHFEEPVAEWTPNPHKVEVYHLSKQEG
jgi:predicted RNase H-like HicB family nuclease